MYVVAESRSGFSLEMKELTSKGLGFGTQACSSFRIQASVFGVSGLGFMFEVLGFRAQGTQYHAKAAQNQGLAYGPAQWQWNKQACRLRRSKFLQDQSNRVSI